MEALFDSFNKYTHFGPKSYALKSLTDYAGKFFIKNVTLENVNTVQGAVIKYGREGAGREIKNFQ